jgi:hypothetical protein
MAWLTSSLIRNDNAQYYPVLSDARVNARESKDHEGASCNQTASGISSDIPVEHLDAAWQRTLHRDSSTPPQSLFPFASSGSGSSAGSSP